jgi:anti-anti-sigma regulatory factor
MESFEPRRFDLRQSIDGDGLIRVVVVGELDVATADLLTVRLRVLGEAGRAVLLDVSRLSFVDARGLRAVTSSVAEAAHQGWDLHVDRNCAACFERLLELTGAADYVWPPSDAGQALRPGPRLPYRVAGWSWHGETLPPPAGTEWSPAARQATTDPSHRLSAPLNEPSSASR